MKTQYTKDLANKQIRVERIFKAPLSDVWKAWTTSEILEQWWAPRPFKAVTKSHDFRAGGRWLYYMLGPDGSQHWCKADYLKVSVLKSYQAKDAFCDEQGKSNGDFPSMHWTVNFSEDAGETMVSIVIQYASVEDMQKITSMGFEEGFAMAHDNLDEFLLKK